VPVKLKEWAVNFQCFWDADIAWGGFLVDSVDSLAVIATCPAYAAEKLAPVN